MTAGHYYRLAGNTSAAIEVYQRCATFSNDHETLAIERADALLSEAELLLSTGSDITQHVQQCRPLLERDNCHEMQRLRARFIMLENATLGGDIGLLRCTRTQYPMNSP